MLRFMGDMPEPRFSQTNGAHKDTTPVMTKLYSTLSRNFSRKDLEDAQLAFDSDSVSNTDELGTRGGGFPWGVESPIWAHSVT